jgi:hypothetical protein
MSGEKKRRGLGNRRGINVKPEDDAAAAERRKRDLRIFELRTVQKLTFPAISEEMGLPETTAREGFRRVMDSMVPENIEQVRAEEEANLQRLSQENLLDRRAILERLNERKADGSYAAGPEERAELAVAHARVIQNAVKISDSRRRLHGADRPVKHEVTGPGGAPVAVATARMSLSELLALGEENAREGELEKDAPEEGE